MGIFLSPLSPSHQLKKRLPREAGAPDSQETHSRQRRGSPFEPRLFSCRRGEPPGPEGTGLITPPRGDLDESCGDPRPSGTPPRWHRIPPRRAGRALEHRPFWKLPAPRRSPRRHSSTIALERNGGSSRRFPALFLRAGQLPKLSETSGPT